MRTIDASRLHSFLILGAALGAYVPFGQVWSEKRLSPAALGGD